MKDKRFKAIEAQTNYDVLNIGTFEIDVINRYSSDNITHTIHYYGKTSDELIQEINNI